MRVLVVLIVLLSCAPTARADMPPDEPRMMALRCTVELQCAGGRTCPVGQAADPGEVARCEEAALREGLRFRCSSWGTQVADAVYCPAGAPGGCSLQEQCPDGRRCHDSEQCDQDGYYERCRAPVEGGEGFFTIYCPNDSEPPPPGQSYSAQSGCGGCTAAGGAPPWTPLGLVVLTLLGLRRLTGASQHRSRRGTVSECTAHHDVRPTVGLRPTAPRRPLHRCP